MPEEKVLKTVRVKPIGFLKKITDHEIYLLIKNDIDMSTMGRGSFSNHDVMLIKLIDHKHPRLLEGERFVRVLEATKEISANIEEISYTIISA